MRVLLFCILVALQIRGFAHEGSVSYLWITNSTEGTSGEWQVAIKDLDLHLSLDEDRNDRITWGEVRTRRPDLEQVLRQAVQFRTNGERVEPRFRECLAERRSGVAYLVLRFDLPVCPESVAYSFHIEMDLSHRVILQSGGNTQMLTADRRLVSLATRQPWLSFLKEGAFHIWSGPDHILFLFALLLPVCLARKDLVPTSSLALAWSVAKIVTAFTIAHSITLVLAVLHLANPPARLIESIIAGSVLLAAVNSFKPLWNDRGWVIAFVFGLVHGFGFAGPLLDAELTPSSLVPALGLFNLGVELGQALIVALALPALLFIRTRELIRLPILRAASVVIAGFACIWLLERGFDLAIFAS